jgi:diguanylate cyclase (GGDEF)-like protein
LRKVVSIANISPLAYLFGAPVAAAALMLAAEKSQILVITGRTLPLVVGFCLYTIAALAFLRRERRDRLHLELMALSDSLCGLPNRRALHRNIHHDVVAGTELAVALFDLDGFKMVNDSYGHSVGDRTINTLAEMLRELCGDGAITYRLGGDEFAIVTSGPLAANILEGLCRKLLLRLADPIEVDGISITLSASIGLARGLAGQADTSSALLRQADVAMYVAKARGKGRVTWFNEEFDRDRAALQTIDLDLRAALKHDELQVHYQPLIDCGTGRITAVEALVRWERPDGQRIGPDVFIPVAEETGLIEAIGLWVLRRACRDALAWDGIKVSVNVSAVQLRNTQFPLQLGQILEETGFPAERLELELTETFLVGDPVIAGRNLEMLRDFGVGIALDDYGTGYASIGFLRRFRFEKLKLDRSLIVDSAGDSAIRTVMVSSVTMAKALGMQVTAEGVETEIHASMARTAGCDQLQGWLYSKAVNAGELEQQLAVQVNERSLTDQQSSETRPKRARAVNS